MLESSSELNIEELGGRSLQQELLYAALPYVKEEDSEKHRCTVVVEGGQQCGKLFKAPSFVQKHISNKHKAFLEDLAAPKIAKVSEHCTALLPGKSTDVQFTTRQTTSITMCLTRTDRCRWVVAPQHNMEGKGSPAMARGVNLSQTIRIRFHSREDTWALRMAACHLLPK